MADLTVIILTKNEEKNIVHCIRSVSSIAARVIVIDSGSTDGTIELVQENGAEVVVHTPFVNQATQFNWGLDNIPIHTEWILRIDADERVMPELAEEIEVELQRHANDDINGFSMRKRFIFMGRWLKHGGTYSVRLPLLFRYGFGRIEMKKMDEHTLIQGKVLPLKNDLLHYDFKGLDSWIYKHIHYAARECEDYFERYCTHSEQVKETLWGGQEQRKRFLKNGVYYNLPLFWRAWLYYIYRYYIRLGFLDGREGKIYYFLQAYWYRFLVDSKIYEQEIAAQESRGE